MSFGALKLLAGSSSEKEREKCLHARIFFQARQPGLEIASVYVAQSLRGVAKCSASAFFSCVR